MKYTVKLAMSNVAWPQTEENVFLDRIKQEGCSGLEIAASKVWSEPIDIDLQERQAYRASVNKKGLEIQALQAILYSRPDLGLFKDKATVAKTVDYLKKLCHLAADLGARILVYGSPASRMRKGISLESAFERASLIFSIVSAEAEKRGVIMCIEPLSPEHTDFINTAIEGLRLVKMVASSGFGLHLDSAALASEGEEVAQVIKKVLPSISHFHASEPDLGLIGSSGKVNHALFGQLLREHSYEGYVSIEMRLQPDYDFAVSEGLAKARKLYFEN